MRAYEIPAEVSREGKLELPDTLSATLPRDQQVRAIVLAPERSDEEDAPSWARLTAEQFLSGYDEVDVIYDEM